MPDTPRHPLGTGWSAGFGGDRINALSDGVFSIAMTLLVLDMHVPALPDGTPDAQIGSALRLALRHLLAPLLAYIISFVVLGVYWNAHRSLMHYVRHNTHAFVWLNTLFLMCIAFVPFPAGLLGRYPGQTVAVVVYGLTLIVVGLFLLSLWIYAMTNNRLTDGTHSQAFVHLGAKIFALPPILYACAVALAFVDVRLSFAVYLFVPLLYIFRGWIDRQIAHQIAVRGDAADDL